MPVPKKKTSRMRSGKRRIQHLAKLPSLTKCQKCGQSKLPHKACSGCGHYKSEKNR